MNDSNVGMGVNILRKMVFALLRITLIPFFIREVIQREKITIIMYHDPKPDVADKHFEILKNKYNFISLKEYLEARKSGNINRLPPKSLIITIDDGNKNNYKLKTLFEKYHITPTIFLCSGVVGTNRHFWFNEDINNKECLKKISDEKRLDVLKKYGFKEQKEYDERQALSKDEIVEMKNIVDFQSHTMFHPVLTKCSDDKAYREISQSKRDLEYYYKIKVYVLSYPNGNYSDSIISMAKKSGYECGITVDVGFNSQNTDLFKLKRMSVRDDADINELLVKVSGLWWYVREIFDHIISIFKSKLIMIKNE